MDQGIGCEKFLLAGFMALVMKPRSRAGKY